MTQRIPILIGAGAGLVWAFAVVFGAWSTITVFLPPAIALPGALIAPGLVMAAMVGRLALRRFSDAGLSDGEAYRQGTPGWTDQRVLADTVVQAALALLIWPFVALVLGGGLVLVMGFALALSRVLFWIGCHHARPLRAFGFAATFYTTVVAGLWSILVWL